MDMERRQSRRLNVFFNTGIISGNENYSGFTGNISENGLYVRISSAHSSIIFVERTRMDLKLKLHMHEELDLYCRLVWSYELPLYNSKGKSAYNMGMKILALSSNYKNFYRNLAVENLKEHIRRSLL